mmetsp:Transcript_99673/g.172987  ORF Transcript_99673/g.172987 Transcript_99673/m.172987 type:complete len:254 (-) Transcript_99673:4197-4958(-)
MCLCFDWPIIAFNQVPSERPGLPNQALEAAEAEVPDERSPSSSLCGVLPPDEGSRPTWPVGAGGALEPRWRRAASMSSASRPPSLTCSCSGRLVLESGSADPASVAEEAASSESRCSASCRPTALRTPAESSWLVLLDVSASHGVLPRGWLGNGCRQWPPLRRCSASSGLHSTSMFEWRTAPALAGTTSAVLLGALMSTGDVVRGGVFARVSSTTFVSEPLAPLSLAFNCTLSRSALCSCLCSRSLLCSTSAG